MTEPELMGSAEMWARCFEAEAAVEIQTRAYITRAGDRASVAWEMLGDCLALLDAAASCAWGCNGGKHETEYLVARVIGTIRAAIRLMRAGLYDEALVVLRSGGEMVNLLWLLYLDTALREKWLVASPRKRYQLARPTQVTKQLLDRGFPTPIDADRYDRTSRIAHGNTDKAPQSHNSIGVPLIAGAFQAEGSLLILNETALVAALAVAPAAYLTGVPSHKHQEYRERAADLMLNVGGINVTAASTGPEADPGP